MDGENRGKKIAAKLDMSLDELIAAAPSNRRGGRGGLRGVSFRARNRGTLTGGRGRSNFGGSPSSSTRMKIDEIGEGRNSSRRFNSFSGEGRFKGDDMIRKVKEVLEEKRVPRGGSWRGSNSFASFNRKRMVRSNFNNNPDSTMDVDDNGMMSDGEIPTLPSARRELLLESRRRQQNMGGGRRRRTEGRFVRISGLDYSILQEDVEELFQSVGPTEKCWIDYDRTDRSLGTGGVIFERVSDAQNAIAEFNGRLIDGQPLKLEIVYNHGMVGGDF